MGLRTIMIFPDFDNMEIIKNIRDKYDPLAKLVRPHITIVFPFDINLNDNEITHILDDRLKGLKPFEIALKGFSKCEDKFGNYLLLDMVKGKDIITEMHNILYSNEFSILNTGLPYEPHMTVGKFPTVGELNKAYDDVKNVDSFFTSFIKKVSVEMIGENEESIIIIEKQLGS